MFEEDLERCFICQAPAKGLYCSAECRLQDKGSHSPMVKANGEPPVRLTAQLPAHLSPMVRPTHVVAPSPVFAGRRRGTSTSSSSLSESPIQSPQTNPSGSDSPQKDVFNLPPPAYPAFLGATPVKIPPSYRVPSTGSTNGATVTGVSVDTLRFGRKSSVTNSVTSPLALTPRCGCGRAAGHRPRSRDALGDAIEQITCLNLGPSVTAEEQNNPLRMVSEPCFRTKGTPNIPCPTLPEDRSITSVLGSSLLSRSRSDPAHPPSPRVGKGRIAQAPVVDASAGIHPRPALELSGLTPPEHAQLPSVAPQRVGGTRSRSAAVDDRRGRSRERVLGRADMTPELPRATLEYHEEREVAPTRSSRSRPRDGRSRSRRRLEDDYAYGQQNHVRGRTPGVAA